MAIVVKTYLNNCRYVSCRPGIRTRLGILGILGSGSAGLKRRKDDIAFALDSIMVRKRNTAQSKSFHDDITLYRHTRCSKSSMDVCHFSICMPQDTNLVLVGRRKLQLISALLRHNHSHRKAGLQFDIRARKFCIVGTGKDRSWWNIISRRYICICTVEVRHRDEGYSIN
jgi:hypothetical protein